MEATAIRAFQEFYRKVKGSAPSGQLWDVYRTNLAVDSAMLRTMVDAAGLAAGGGRRAAPRASRGSTTTRNTRRTRRRRCSSCRTTRPAPTSTRACAAPRGEARDQKFVLDYIKNPKK